MIKLKCVLSVIFIDVYKCREDSYEKDDYYCFIGRLSHEKGITTLVEAARQLPYKLKIIGGGPLMEQLEIIDYGN